MSIFEILAHFRPAQFWIEKRLENGQGRRFPHFWPRNPDRSVHTARASHPEVEETAPGEILSFPPPASGGAEQADGFIAFE